MIFHLKYRLKAKLLVQRRPAQSQADTTFCTSFDGLNKRVTTDLAERFAHGASSYLSVNKHKYITLFYVAIKNTGVAILYYLEGVVAGDSRKIKQIPALLREGKLNNKNKIHYQAVWPAW